MGREVDTVGSEIILESGNKESPMAGVTITAVVECDLPKVGTRRYSPTSGSTCSRRECKIPLRPQSKNAKHHSGRN